MPCLYRYRVPSHYRVPSPSRSFTSSTGLQSILHLVKQRKSLTRYILVKKTVIGLKLIYQRNLVPVTFFRPLAWDCVDEGSVITHYSDMCIALIFSKSLEPQQNSQHFQVVDVVFRFWMGPISSWGHPWKFRPLNPLGKHLLLLDTGVVGGWLHCTHLPHVESTSVIQI